MCAFTSIATPQFFGILLLVFIVVILSIVFIVKRIKNVSVAFKKGYKMVLPLTENKTLLKNIEQLKEPNFENKEKSKFGKKKKGSSYQAIRQEWKAIINQNQKNIERLYDRGIIPDWVECRTKMENDFAFEDEIYSLLANWLERVDWSNSSDVKTLYKYIALVSNGDYGLNSLVLLKYHKRILTSIKQLILKEDFTIIETLHNGNLGKLTGNLINLYFHHTRNNYNKGHLVQFDIDRKEIANIIPNFIKAFPENCSNLTLHILENNTDNLIEVFADLLHFYIKNQIAHNYSFTSELFGKYQEPSNPVYKNAAIILKKTIQSSNFVDTQVEYLIDEVVLRHLDLNSLESQEQEISNHIDNLKKNNFEEKIIRKYEKELLELSLNFEDIYTENGNKAVRRLAVSRSIFKSVEVLEKKFPNYPKIKVLSKLLDETKTYKNRPKLYKFNQKPQVVFKDLHFKYLVIEELMYNQQILLPGFDVRYLAKEYDKREIDVEAEGYEVIPEVRKYFKNLDISHELLAKVTTLYQDSGLGGGSAFIYQLQPFWDPGSGDEVFKITNKAIDDLELLPNLKKIIGLENSAVSRKFIEVCSSKKIMLSREDMY